MTNEELEKEHDKSTKYVYRIDYVDGTNMKFDTDININLGDIRMNYQGHGSLSFNDMWVNLSHVKQITKMAKEKNVDNCDMNLFDPEKEKSND